MQDKYGRFVKGTHWRPRQPWWDHGWLYQEYVEKKRSAVEIADAGRCTENNILYWLKRHGIQARSVSEIRAFKKWGASGAKNPMFGKRGILNPNWKGGLTPARQAIYSSLDWKAFTALVRRRDKACRLCGCTKALDIHHIDPFSEAPLLVMDIGNVIRLCQNCHRRLRGKERRWRKRLFRLLQEGGEASVRR